MISNVSTSDSAFCSPSAGIFVPGAAEVVEEAEFIGNK